MGHDHTTLTVIVQSQKSALNLYLLRGLLKGQSMIQAAPDCLVVIQFTLAQLRLRKVQAVELQTGMDG